MQTIWILLFIILINILPYFIEYKFIRVQRVNMLPYILWFNTLVLFYFILPEYYIK